ncbi:MAG: tape measure protein [Sulfolobales archaeon]
MRDLIVRIVLQTTQATQRAIEKIWQNLANVGSAGIQAGKNFVSNVVNQIKTATGSIIQHFTSLQGIISGIIAGAITQRIVKSIDEYQSVLKKLSGVYPIEEAERFARALRDISISANVDFSFVVNSFLQLRNILGDDRVALKFVENLILISDTLGEDARAMQNFIMTIIRGFTTGELNARQLVSILQENAVVVNFLAQQMGITSQQLIQSFLEGKITAEDLVNTILQLDPSKLSGFTTSFEHIGGLLTLIKNLIGQIFTLITGDAIPNALVKIKTFLIENENKIKAVAVLVFGLFQSIFTFIGEIGKGLLNAITPPLNFLIGLLSKTINAIWDFEIALANFLNQIINAIIEGLRRVLNLIASIVEKIPVIGDKIVSAAKAVSNFIKNYPLNIVVTATVKSSENFLKTLQKARELWSKTPETIEVEQTGKITFPKLEVDKEGIQEQIHETIDITREVIRDTKPEIPVPIQPVPVITEITPTPADIFLQELQKEIGDFYQFGVQIGGYLAQGIGEGFHHLSKEMLAPLLLKSLTQTLAVLQPQLAPLILTIGGILQGLLSQSPELETTLEKATEIKQEINIYIERADISDKGFWEELVINRIGPAMDRLKTIKQGWGI